jgi:hypothetical protein
MRLPVPAPLMLALPLLAACAAAPAAPPAKVTAARLSDRVLTLDLSDGTTCRADWRAAPAGRMERCGPGFGYAVTPEPRPNPLRRALDDGARVLGAEGLLAPMAEVVVTDPAGIDTVFASPPPVAD